MKAFWSFGAGDLRLSQVRGSQEKRANGINNTVSEVRTQLTQQLAKSAGGALGFAQRQVGTSRDSSGMASIVIVTVLVVIMTLVSIGFARIMNRSIISSANRQQSLAATYAAQSAINDVSSFIKAGNTGASATQCNDLIGSGRPLAGYASLSPDAKYTCLLLNNSPTDIKYDNIAADKTKVVKVTASGVEDKFMISWQSNVAAEGFPPSQNLYDETTWNDTSHNYVPMMRVTLYPIPASGSLAQTQAKSKTFFLYPQHTVGIVSRVDYASTRDGSLFNSSCVSKTGGESLTVPPGIFNGSADYDCNVVINNLTSAFGGASSQNYYYLKFTPIYGGANVKVKANDTSNTQLQFVNIQSVVDATANVGNVSKRLQARVDISSVTSGVEQNVSSSDASIPDQALRSASAVCKRIQDIQSVFNYVDYSSEPTAVCHSDVATSSPAPTMSLSISGQDWNGGGYSSVIRDSSDNTPGASGHYGTVYIPYNGNASVNWSISDATSCTSSWSPTPNISAPKNNNGSKGFGGITSVTNYTLQCSRAGASLPAKTVTAWPPPTVSVSAPNQVNVNQTYNVTWSSNNAVNCDASGDWNQSNIGASGSHSLSHSSAGTYYYTITCKDPVGRQGVASTDPGVAVTPGSSCTGGCSGTNVVNPPPPPPQIVKVDLSNLTGTGGTWHYKIIDNGDGTGLWYCNIFRNGAWIMNVGSTNQFEESGNVSWSAVGNDRMTLTCRSTDGATGSVDAPIPKPTITVTVTGASGWWNQSSAPSLCKKHDKTHYWLICASWTSSMSDGSPVYPCYLYWRGDNGSAGSGGPWRQYSDNGGDPLGFTASTGGQSGFIFVGCTSANDSSIATTSSGVWFPKAACGFTPQGCPAPPAPPTPPPRPLPPPPPPPPRGCAYNPGMIYPTTAFISIKKLYFGRLICA